MNESLEIFLKLRCLTELSTPISALEIRSKWFKNSDKRHLSQTLQKFIDINKNELSFLNITPVISGSDANLHIAFKTEKYVGAVPLRSPVNGKQMGDFIIIPRYTKGNDNYGDYIEILNLLDSNLNAEFYNSIPLLSGNNFKPPLYFEASKYILFLYKLSKIHWVKFQNIEKNYRYPSSQVNWEKYIKYEYNPNSKLIFPNKSNILTQLHQDYFKLKYVYEIAKSEISSFRTPLSIKLQLSSYIQQLDQKLYYFYSTFSNNIMINSSDNKIVRGVKFQANKILNKNFDIGRAWRIDIAEIFERYIQYIFTEINKEIGGSIFLNYKFKKTSKKNFTWELSHLEPDIVLKTNTFIIFIDAKYKSHFYNRRTFSDILKEDHRSDLHQILSYSSFSKQENKIGVLCYPSDDIYHHEIIYENKISNVQNKILIIGIPFNKSKLFMTKEYILKILDSLATIQ